MGLDAVGRLLTGCVEPQVGVAFTRYQTAYFQGKYGNLDSSVISYGPCQTPTLTFCVQRHQRIVSFQPEPFWTVLPLARGSSRGTRRPATCRQIAPTRRPPSDGALPSHCGLEGHAAADFL